MDFEKIKAQKSIKELIEFSIINLDKPSGPTSFLVADLVRKKLAELGVRKTSHFGTLDPKVTGVLPIAINRACRLTGYFMKKEKEYIGVMRIHQDISDSVLTGEVAKFIGKIIQKPPVKSRVKRVEREREVKRFEILERNGKDVLFLSEVEAGTYIRKLIDDLGKNIGGAHMLELRRTKAGIFSEPDSHSLYKLDEALESYKKGDEKKLREMLIPGEIIGKIMPVVYINKENIPLLLRGSPIFKKFLKSMISLDNETNIAVFCGDTFIEISRIINDGEIIAKPVFVLN